MNCPYTCLHKYYYSELAKIWFILIVAVCISALSVAQTSETDAGTKLSSGIVWYRLNSALHETEPHATLYFFRAYINPLIAPLKKLSLTLNDAPICELKSNRMVSILVKPGRYKISADKKDKTAMYLTIKAGNEYFFEGFLPNSIASPPMSLTNIKPDIARKETGLPAATK